MEILDEGLGPFEIIEIEEVPLEIEDRGTLPGAQFKMTAPEEEERDTDWENDGDHCKFLSYMKNKLSNIPQHTGNTTVGCERAIMFLKRLDKEISKAIQSDEDNIIDEQEAEDLRDMIIDYIDKLEEAHSKLLSDKKPKRASVKIGKEVVARLNDGQNIQFYIPVIKDDVEELLPVSVAEPTPEQVQLFVAGEDESTITKEAYSAKIVLFEDPFLHSITRVLINSSVSAGRNMEDVYQHLKKKYAFTPREELSIQELLLQKGVPIYKDFGRLGEPADPADGKGIELNTIYPA